MNWDNEQKKKAQTQFQMEATQGEKEGGQRKGIR